MLAWRPGNLKENHMQKRELARSGLQVSAIEKLMALADKGINKPDELCKRALKGLPRRRAA